MGRNIVLLPWLCCALLTAWLLPENTHASRELRGDDGKATAQVVGGAVAKRGRFPYQATWVAGNGLAICGGSLIAERIVLTAGHCFAAIKRKSNDGIVVFDELPDVLLGGNNLGFKKSYEKRKSIAGYVHPKYGQKGPDGNVTLEYDVALLLLDKPSRMQPVRVATAQQAAKLRAGSVLLASGYGLLKAAGVEPKSLRQVYLPYLGDYKACAKWPAQCSENQQLCSDFHSSLLPGMICAGNAPSFTRDTCQGDSGGPLIKPGKSAKDDVQYGLTSFGIGCAGRADGNVLPEGQRTPGVYTSVGFYEDFIKSAIRGLLAGKFKPKTACKSFYVGFPKLLPKAYLGLPVDKRGYPIIPKVFERLEEYLTQLASTEGLCSNTTHYVGNYELTSISRPQDPALKKCFSKLPLAYLDVNGTAHGCSSYCKYVFDFIECVPRGLSPCPDSKAESLKQERAYVQGYDQVCKPLIL